MPLGQQADEHPLSAGLADDNRLTSKMARSSSVHLGSQPLGTTEAPRGGEAMPTRGHSNRQRPEPLLMSHQNPPQLNRTRLPTLTNVAGQRRAAFNYSRPPWIPVDAVVPGRSWLSIR